MATNRIMLEASLDPGAVNASLTLIKKRVDDMAKFSDVRMKQMGKNTEEVYKSLTQKLNNFIAQAQRAPLTGKSKEQFEELQEEIIKTAEQLEQIIAKKKRIEGIDIGKGIKFGSIDTSIREDIEKDLASVRGDTLRDRLAQIMDYAEGDVREKAQRIKQQLEKMLSDPANKGDELIAELKRLDSTLDEILEQDFQKRIIGTTAGSTIGGDKQQLKFNADKIIGDDVRQQLESKLDRLMQSADSKVAEGAQNIRARLLDLFDAPIDENFSARLNKLVAETKKLEGVKPLDIVTEQEKADVADAEARLTLLARISAETAGKLSESAQKEVAAQQLRAQAAVDYAKTNQITGKDAIKIVNDATKVVNNQAKAYGIVTDEVKDLQKEISKLQPVDEKIQAKEAANKFDSVIQNTNRLLDSQQKEVRDIAIELQKMATEAKRAFDAGEKDAKEFNDELNKIEDRARRTGRAFGEDIPAGTERGTVSLWKLGNAADRVGVRAAGGILRITDALKSFGPLAIAGAVALGGILIVLNKIVQALAEVAKKAAQMFAEFTKNSVESARSIEVLDRQLSGFLSRPGVQPEVSDQLGRAYRDLLLEKSFEVGLNLTSEFSKVVVPLAKDLDQVEKAADIAASLAHAFQETDDAIANAIKQAAGGHFRPLIERFGLTESEVQKIKDYQETMGELGGVLEGLGEAIDRRGLDIENFHGTLQFLIGQFDVLREQVQITFGEPVRDALAEQLDNLFSLVEDNKDAILGFFDSLGEVVGDVLGTIGNVVEELIGPVTEGDLNELESRLQELGEEIGTLIESIGELIKGDEDRTFIDVLVSATDAAIKLADALEDVTRIFQGLNKLRTGFGLGDTPFFRIGNEFVKGLSGLNLPSGAIASFGYNLKLLSEGGATPEESEAIVNQILRSIPVIGGFAGGYQEYREIKEENEDTNDALASSEADLASSIDGTTDSMRDAIDAAQQYQSRIAELEALESKAVKAQEEIDEALMELEEDRFIEEEKLRTKFARQRNAADVKRSEDREDLEARHIQRLLKFNEDYHFNREQAVEGFDRKETDLHTKYQDKLTDIDRDEAEKKIDIEKKFRDKLADIRARFDLDAEEAIRRNDAVALLRIRRRMELELDQAKIQRDRQEEEAADAAQKKRDEAKIWLDREIRDNDEAEKRKLDDLLEANDLKRKQINDQYNWELGQIDVEYNRQKDKIDLNETQAIEDMNKNFDHRNEELNRRMEEQFNIVKEWEDAKVEYSKIKLQEMIAIQQAWQQLYSREGSLTRYLNPGGIGDNPYVDPYAPNDTGLGSRGGGSVYIPTISYSGNRQHGGFVTSQNQYRINERGHESFLASRSGIIVPREPFLMSPTASRGSTTIDNSQNISADMSLLDPSYVSPIQRAITRQIITEEYLKFGLLGT